MNQKINNKKSYLITIEITEDSWFYKKGQQIKFVIFAKSDTSKEKIIEDIYSGSEFPNYNIINEEMIGNDFLFSNFIQKGIIKK